MNHPKIKIPYLLLQGIFLPLLWLLDTFYRNGQTAMAWGAFALYEGLIIADALLYWIIFERSEK